MGGEIGAIREIRRDAVGETGEFLPSSPRVKVFGRQHDDDLAVAMGGEVGVVETAFALGRAAFTRCQKPRQPAVGGAVLGKGEQAHAVAKIEAAADDEADADFLRRLICPHDTGDAVMVGNRDRPVAECRRGHDQFGRVRRAAQEREIGRDLQFGVTDGTVCHVWTAPVGQGEFGGRWHWSGAVMYSACRCGRWLTAGRDGLRGSGAQHCGALCGAMTNRRVPTQVLTIVPSLPPAPCGVTGRRWLRRVLQISR